jgi:colanic acid biosynthesis glycosyl transferase WcaI
MRILLISQFFQPEPFLKGVIFARELMNLGHKVQVLTGLPNYPGGKIYAGYKVKLFQREVIDGVPVARVPLYPSHDKSGIRRFFNYISFALSAAVIGPWLIEPADVAYVYHPPATVQFAALVIRLLRRTPLVYDIQDLWPDSLEASSMFTNRAGLWLVDRICRFFYRRARKIVVLSPGYKDELVRRGVPVDKIEVIYNWCDESGLRPVPKDPALAEKLGMAGYFCIVFAGGLGKGQSLGSVLEAARIVQSRNRRIRFVFVGSGIEEDFLKQKARDLVLDNVVFLARRPISEVSSILSLADVLLVHLKDNALYAMTIPSKTQAYLAVGKPILIGVRGNAAELVAKAHAGLPCEPENPQSIAEMVLKFEAMGQEELDKMAENGRRFYRQELSVEAGAKRFEKVFQEAVKNAGRVK